MSRYSISREARDDLKRIYHYVADHNETAAVRLRDAFIERFRFLATNPLMGEVRDDLFPGLRLFTVGNYAILYLPRDSGVRIVMVVHAARDFPALFKERHP